MIAAIRSDLDFIPQIIIAAETGSVLTNPLLTFGLRAWTAPSSLDDVGSVA
jgi:hypothetical protein